MGLRPPLESFDDQVALMAREVCDSCGRRVEDPTRWRHEECPPPALPAVFVEARARLAGGDR